MLTIVPKTGIGSAVPLAWPHDCPPVCPHVWKQLSASIRLHAQHDALYSAVRTFCWEPRRIEQHAILALTLRSPCTGVMADEPSASRHSRANPREFTGPACLIGGVVIIAWITLAHSPLREPSLHADAVSGLTNRQEIALQAPHAAQVPLPRNEAPPLAIETQRMPARATKKTMVVNAALQSVGNRTPDVLRKHRRHGRETAPFDAVPHASPTSDSIVRQTRLVAAPRLHVRDRAADRRPRIASSPMDAGQDGAFAQLPEERLATAKTRGTTVTTSPDATDWMNHMVQRRITEVAEKFSGSM